MSKKARAAFQQSLDGDSPSAAISKDATSILTEMGRDHHDIDVMIESLDALAASMARLKLTLDATEQIGFNVAYQFTRMCRRRIADAAEARTDVELAKRMEGA